MNIKTLTLGTTATLGGLGMASIATASAAPLADGTLEGPAAKAVAAPTQNAPTSPLLGPKTKWPTTTTSQLAGAPGNAPKNSLRSGGARPRPTAR